jgi:hypothetical protein
MPLALEMNNAATCTQNIAAGGSLKRWIHMVVLVSSSTLSFSLNL